MPESAPARGWKMLAPVVLAACGALLVITAKTSGGTDLRGSEVLEMPDLVRAEERRVEELIADAENLRSEIDELTEQLGDNETKEIQQQLEELQTTAALGSVEGSGITVTLDDSPQADTPEQDLAPGTHVEDYIIHQQDLEAVMNALWAGGADAMMVMDQRIGNTSTVRCVGPVLQLEGKQYSPPYTISAIGDTDAMLDALERSEAVEWFRAAADAYGLGYEVEMEDLITMPAYEGSRLSRSES
ncbi:DUF881 domain-containing protein [Phytoactinopolyspora halotolerans]|uniref:DUF881 domain-containing protein n=1 Tax=Phytoactinopolyspora halotolerans TaxID=1981512 RepID=A0A6L9S2Q7_9ACTN|nr:DUF881 domain-containing protein [Phytoactinopolyspora halotolerans]NED98717.1 DUF881 domain-containing protein [Phytoactinopolyspora halotolerans]